MVWRTGLAVPLNKNNELQDFEETLNDILKDH